jgi:hypothetical protein
VINSQGTFHTFRTGFANGAAQWIRTSPLLGPGPTELVDLARLPGLPPGAFFPQFFGFNAYFVQDVGPDIQTDVTFVQGSDLAAHFQFEGNADDVTGLHHGTLMNAASFTPAGVYGQALDLTGGDGYVEIPSGVLSGEPQCTLSYWVRVNSLQSPYTTVFSEGLGGPGAMTTSLLLGSPPLFLFENAGSALVTAPILDVAPSAWHHVAFTFDAGVGEAKSYLNGGLLDTQSISPGDVCGAGVASRIGAFDSGSYFDGQIDDLRIYRRALGESEVSDLFNQATLVSSGRIQLQFITANLQDNGNVNVHWLGTDHAFELWPYYRVAGDAQETRFPAPDSVSFEGYEGILSWNNVGSRGFSATATFFAYDCGALLCTVPDSGAYGFSLEVMNSLATPLDLSLFAYHDADLDGGFTNHTARLVSNPTAGVPFDAIEVRASPQTTLHLLTSQGLYAVDAFPTLRNALDDTAVTNFTNSGVPFGPADFTSGFQHQVTLAPLGSPGSSDSWQAAYLLDLIIFGDGFEAGSTSAWSASVP